MNWIKDGKVTLTDTEIFESPGKGTGLRFTKDNASGIVARVSADLLINAKNVSTWTAENKYLTGEYLEFMKKSLEWLKSEKDIIVLFMALLLAEGPSEMSDYLASLPKPKDMDQPWSWPENEIFDSLKGTSILMACVHKKSHVHARYEALVGTKGGDKLVSEQQFTLAEQWEVSRSLEIPESPDSETIALTMVPVLDYVNHSPNVNCRFEVDNGDVVLVVMKCATVKAGDEVFINYGPDKSAAEFLFCYGFIDADHGVTKNITLETPLMLSFDEIEPEYLLQHPDCDPELKSMILKFHSYGNRSRLIKLEALNDAEDIIAKVDCDWLWMLTLPVEDLKIDETTAAAEFKGNRLLGNMTVSSQLKQILGDDLDEYMTETSSMKEDIGDYVGHLVREVFIPQLETEAKSSHPMAALLRQKEKSFLESIDDIEV
ncbi:SET domain-containing protein 8 [Yarrowia sp. B02]|nr:SET domain-containing protein 8 [Yarrowia sp. B02]